jgi:hypothetical protein
MRSITATLVVGLMAATAFDSTALAQNPNRGNGVNGIYTTGWPIQGTPIRGAYIHGAYIAPPSSIPFDYRPHPFEYSWTQTYSYPMYVPPNYSTVYPTRYGPWR